MSSYTGLSPDNPRRYTGANVFLSTVVTRKREPTGADYRQPETGSLYRTGSFWLIGPAPTNGAQGDLWYLSKIVSNVAFWIKFGTGSSGPLLNVDVDAATAPGVDPVTPDGTGLMTVTGQQVASGQAGTQGVQTHSTALYQYQVRVQQSTTAASVNTALNGLSHFSSDHFTNTTGFVDSKPATSQAASAFANAGISSFFNAQFSVDANGFVQLVGGTAPAIQKVNVDASTAPGTDPVIADGSGQIIVTGGQVAAGVVGTNVIRTDSLAANTYTIEVQRSTTAATPTVASNGVSHFNSFNFNVDSNGFVSAKSGLTPGVSNLGIDYNAGTGVFSITAADGSALSSTNPAFVTLQSKSDPGELVTVAVTANQSFIDDNGASQIIGNLFGLTTGIAFANPIPFFIYAVLDDTETAIAFMISRYPNTKVSPVAAKIGKSGSAVADSQGSFFSLANITVADYESNPCLSIGSFRMTMSNLDDWTVTTLDIQDGIGSFQEDRKFSMSTGQFGAASGKFFANNGGTAPAFTSNSYAYFLNRQNMVTIYTAFANASTAGVGSVNLQLATPYILDGSSTGCSFFIVLNGALFFLASSLLVTATSSNLVYFPGTANGLATSSVLNNTMTAAGDQANINITAPIFFT